MHPLLTPISRFGLYLLAWIPLAGILIYLMAVPGRLGWLDATVLILPLCLIYQFVCLSAWYSCKAAPIQKSTGQRLWLTHVLAAAILSFLWILLAKMLAYGLSQLPAFPGLDSRFPSLSSFRGFPLRDPDHRGFEQGRNSRAGKQHSRPGCGTESTKGPGESALSFQ